MKDLAAALGVTALMLLSWMYPDALAIFAAASHSVAGLATMALIGWSALCVLLIRAVHAGVSA
jgi:hypothetical protein